MPNICKAHKDCTSLLSSELEPKRKMAKVIIENIGLMKNNKVCWRMHVHAREKEGSNFFVFNGEHNIYL